MSVGILRRWNDWRASKAASRLDEQFAEQRHIAETLREPPPAPAVATANGMVANGHVPHVPEAVAHRPALLRVEGLAKEIGGTDILRDITFDVYEGEILGLIGPNGAGKTTLMECLA